MKQMIQQARPRPRKPRQTHGDADIALAYLWAEHNDQPTYWASQPKAYPPAAAFDPPSASTVSRRLRSVPVIELIGRVRLALLDEAEPTPMKQMDTEPLKVGNASNDRDATRGYGAGGKCRGYKFCALGSDQLVWQWTMSSMNENDQTLGLKLLPKLPLACAPRAMFGYVVADNGFDGNPLYIAADEQGHVLVSPPRKANRGVRDARRNSAQRIRSLDISDSPLRHAGVKKTFGSKLLHDRGQVERMLGHAAMLGLNHLPPWVRTPHRVALHVEAKLIFATHRMLEVKREKQRKRTQTEDVLKMVADGPVPAEAGTG
jgi:hypothetical protein